MSLYDCIEKLDTLIPYEHEEPTAYAAFPLQSLMIENMGINFSLQNLSTSIDSMITTLAHDRKKAKNNWLKSSQTNERLDALRERLRTRATVPTYYENLSDEIQEVDDLIELCSKNKTKHEHKINTLTEIKKELEIIQLKFSTSMDDDKVRKAAHQYQPYAIATISQSSQYQLGSSKGECYGFTLAMADSSLTPYGKTHEDTNIPSVKLTEAIHKYQINQDTNNDGLGKIKKSSLSNKKLCVGARDQAKKILKTGKQNQGQHLQIALEASIDAKRGHACYFNYLDDGHIRYADPNGDAYEFKNEEDFLNYYQDFFDEQYSRKGADPDEFHFLSISLLEEQKTLLSDNLYKKPSTSTPAYEGSSRLTKFHNFQSACLYPIIKITHTVTHTLKKTCSENIDHCRAFKHRLLHLKDTPNTPQNTDQEEKDGSNDHAPDSSPKPS